MSQVTLSLHQVTMDVAQLVFTDPPAIAALTPRVAYTGGARTVTLTGVNFSPASSTFNDRPACVLGGEHYSAEAVTLSMVWTLHPES